MVMGGQATDFQIVVAEDDQDDVILLGRAFTQVEVKCVIHYVSDGQELMEWFQQEFSEGAGSSRVLLLLDLKMPRMSGFEFLGWLEQQPFRQRVLVGVLSSSGSTQDITRASGLGASFYIVKPTDPQELVHVVERLQNFCTDAFTEAAELPHQRGH